MLERLEVDDGPDPLLGGDVVELMERAHLAPAHRRQVPEFRPEAEDLRPERDTIECEGLGDGPAVGPVAREGDRGDRAAVQLGEVDGDHVEARTVAAPELDHSTDRVAEEGGRARVPGLESPKRAQRAAREGEAILRVARSVDVEPRRSPAPATGSRSWAGSASHPRSRSRGSGRRRGPCSTACPTCRTGRACHRPCSCPRACPSPAHRRVRPGNRGHPRPKSCCEAYPRGRTPGSAHR